MHPVPRRHRAGPTRGAGRGPATGRLQDRHAGHGGAGPPGGGGRHANSTGRTMSATRSWSPRRATGCSTADAEAVMRENLVPLAALVTPNLDEAAILTGTDPRDPESMEQAGHRLLELGAGAALVKGGHLAGDEVTDVLVTPVESAVIVTLGSTPDPLTAPVARFRPPSPLDWPPVATSSRRLPPVSISCSAQ